jgi:pyruvate/2-oxoglutarate/acetoin dehydrogenase E1 component
VASEIAALAAEGALWSLDAPVARVAVPDTPIPFAPNNEAAVVPGLDAILRAIRGVLP